MNAWRDAHTTGLAAAGDWLSDNWEYIAAGAAVAAGVALMFTGVGGPAGLALMSLSGALTSGGISIAQQKHDNGTVDWTRVGLDAAIGAIPIPGGAAAKSAGAIGRETAETAGREALETTGREAAEQAARTTGERQLSTIGTDAAEKIVSTGIPKEGERVYRIWGKDPTLPDELAQQSGPWGHSWTRVDPRTISNYRDIAGLPEGANYGRFVSEGVVNDASGMTSRSALPLDGNAGGLDEILFQIQRRRSL